MGLLHIYDTVSDKHESVKASGRLCDILPNYDFSHAVIIKAGERLTPDYVVRDDDILYIRTCPSGVTALTVTAIVIAVVAVGVGVTVGLYSYKLAQEAAEKAAKAERNTKKLSQQVTQYPFIKGASNQNALGNAIQYLFGNIYNTPYKLNEGFYSIGGADGSKQYYNVILSAGWGPQLIKTLSIGNEKIKNFTNTSPQELTTGFDYTSLYYDAENVIEIAQEHEFTSPMFQQKVRGEYSGEEIKHDNGSPAEPLIVQLAEHTMKAEICIQFTGLRQFVDNVWVEKTVTVTPYWSNDGGSTWNAFTFDRGNNTFSYNSDHTLRFTATQAFSYAQAYGKQISIKLVRETEKASSNSQEGCYLLYYNSFCYDNKKSSAGVLVPCSPIESPFMEKTTRIGIKIIANSNTSGMLDKFNCMCYGVARTWNKVLRVWSESKTTTRNVASWILEIMGSDTHLPSKISDSQIDPLSFGRLYEYCEENEFYCDGIVTQGIKKETLLSKLLLLCNADMYIDSDGKYSIAIDKKESTPVALLNAQSVRSVIVGKSFERKSDGLKATFTNRKSWQIDTMYVMRDGGEKGIDDTCTETSIEFATNSDHIYKICQRQLRRQVLQPREITVKVGREGDYYPLYSTVYLQLEQLRQGLASAVIHKIIKNPLGKITALEVSDLLDFGNDFSQDEYIDENGSTYIDENGNPYIYIEVPENATYGVIIQAQDENGRKSVGAKVYGFGKSRTVYFLSPLDPGEGVQIQPGNILSFGLLNERGEFDRITNVMKITAVKPESDGWELVLKDYSEAIYEYGIIPEYKSNLTTPTAQALPSETIREEARKSEQAQTNAETVAAVSTAIITSTTKLEVSRTSIQFHINGEDNTLYSETATFTAALMRNGEGVTPDTISATCDSNAFAVSASITGLVITVSVTSVFGASFSGASVTVTVTSGGLSYSNKCTVTASDTGKYLGPIASVANIPQAPGLGDYFTWTGANTQSSLVTGGTLYTSYLYRYTGAHGGTETWTSDIRVEHNASALSDVLNMLSENLSEKNSYGMTFLDRLAVNAIFARTLAVQSAFIDTLMTKTLTVQQNGIIKSNGYTPAATPSQAPSGSGFYMSANGFAEFCNINIRGQATFIGKKVEASGTLVLPMKSNTTGLQEGEIFIYTGS